MSLFNRCGDVRSPPPLLCWCAVKGGTAGKTGGGPPSGATAVSPLQRLRAEDWASDSTYSWRDSGRREGRPGGETQHGVPSRHCCEDVRGSSGECLLAGPVCGLLSTEERHDTRVVSSWLAELDEVCTAYNTLKGCLGDITCHAWQHMWPDTHWC